jgi:excisionase family DNA binding protein
MSRHSGPSTKPLLSVEEAATLLGESRSSVYRSIERGDLPLPVLKINGRLRIARRAVERLLDGELPALAEEGVVKGGFAGEPSERTLDDPAVDPVASHNGMSRSPATGLRASPQSRSRPMCSAARRSSSSTPSV